MPVIAGLLLAAKANDRASDSYRIFSNLFGTPEFVADSILSWNYTGLTPPCALPKGRPEMSGSLWMDSADARCAWSSKLARDRHQSRQAVDR